MRLGGGRAGEGALEKVNGGKTAGRVELERGRME